MDEQLLAGTRIMALGGKHRIFELTCAAIALRELGAREGEGGSGGAIAMGLAMGGLTRERALQVAENFDLNALLDGLERKGLSGIGAVEGHAFEEQLSGLFADLNHEYWGDFRHPANARPPGSDWDYSLTVRVAVYTFANRSLESVQRELTNPITRAAFLARIGMNHRLLVPYTFPFSQNGTAMAHDHERVAPTMVDTARHMLLFRPDLKVDGPHVRALMDGAMFVDMEEQFRNVVPDRPTVLLSFKRDEKNPQSQAVQDRRDFPGYYVLRLPDSYPGMTKVGKHTIDLSLDAEQRVALAQQGFDDVAGLFDEDAFRQYLGEWEVLRANAFAPAGEPAQHWRFPSFPGRLLLGRHELRPATEQIALPADTPVRLATPDRGLELGRPFEMHRGS